LEFAPFEKGGWRLRRCVRRRKSNAPGDLLFHRGDAVVEVKSESPLPPLFQRGESNGNRLLMSPADVDR
jgi:hypothetical protein